MLHNDKTFPEPPTRKRELVEGGVAGLVGAVPVAGPTLQELVHMTMGVSYQQRLDAWFSDVASAITELQRQDEVPAWDKLAEDDDFLDALLRATRAVQGTGREEKRRALRNAVMSSARGIAPGLHRELRFIDIIDMCVPDHLRLLLFLDDTTRALRVRGVRNKDVDQRLETRFRKEFGGSADPPLDFWIPWQRHALLDELLSIFDEPSARELYADLEQWRLADASPNYKDDSYLTESGQDFLRYVDVTPATAEAFSAYADKQW